MRKLFLILSIFFVFSLNARTEREVKGVEAEGCMEGTKNLGLARTAAEGRARTKALKLACKQRGEFYLSKKGKSYFFGKVGFTRMIDGGYKCNEQISTGMFSCCVKIIADVRCWQGLGEEIAQIEENERRATEVEYRRKDIERPNSRRAAPLMVEANPIEDQDEADLEDFSKKAHRRNEERRGSKKPRSNEDISDDADEAFDQLDF